jgi:hypothetical protein
MPGGRLALKPVRQLGQITVCLVGVMVLSPTWVLIRALPLGSGCLGGCRSALDTRLPLPSIATAAFREYRKRAV